MIHGVGTDILLKQRIERILEADSDGLFVRGNFSHDEQEEGLSRDDPPSYFAGRFSAKEAVFKSLGIEDIRLAQIQILSDECGAPRVSFLDGAKELVDTLGIGNVYVSISSDGDYYVAFAVSERG